MYFESLLTVFWLRLVGGMYLSSQFCSYHLTSVTHYFRSYTKCNCHKILLHSCVSSEKDKTILLLHAKTDSHILYPFEEFIYYMYHGKVPKHSKLQNKYIFLLI